MITAQTRKRKRGRLTVASSSPPLSSVDLDAGGPPTTTRPDSSIAAAGGQTSSRADVIHASTDNGGRSEDGSSHETARQAKRAKARLTKPSLAAQRHRQQRQQQQLQADAFDEGESESESDFASESVLARTHLRQRGQRSLQGTESGTAVARSRSQSQTLSQSQTGELELTAPSGSGLNAPSAARGPSAPRKAQSQAPVRSRVHTRTRTRRQTRTLGAGAGAGAGASASPSSAGRTGRFPPKQSESPSKSLHSFFHKSRTTGEDSSVAGSQTTVTTILDIDGIRDDSDDDATAADEIAEDFFSDDEELGQLLQAATQQVESLSQSQPQSEPGASSPAATRLRTSGERSDGGMTLDAPVSQRHSARPGTLVTTSHQQGIARRSASTSASQPSSRPRTARFVLPQTSSPDPPAIPSQATAPVRPGQDNPGPTRPWADQYPPLNLSELAVHHKKVSDVQRWLSDAFQGRHQQKVLVLRGPAGSGKTMTVTLLAKLMGFELVEWRQPAVSEGSSASSLSLSAQFDEFLNRGEQFGALTLAEGSQSPDGGDVDAHVEAAKHDRRALLIEEFPALLGPASIGLQSFRAAVQKYLAAATTPSSPPVIMVVSEAMLNSAGGPHGSFSAFRLLGPEICSHPGLAFIDFNPVAPTFLSKAFTLVLKKHAQRTRRRCDLRPAAIKHFTGTGDIRSAISAVEFYCLQGEHASRPTGSAAPPRSRARSARPTTTHEPLQVVTQREASLGLFHATSKVVHNKRDAPADAADPMLVLPAPPPHLSQHARPLVSQVETESLMNDTGTDASTFLASLHENFPLSCSGAAFCAHFDDCMEYLSQADLLASDSYSSLRGSRAGTGSARSSVLQGYSGEGSDLLRQDEISFHVGVRGLLFALPCPVKRTQGGAGSSRAGCGFAADAHKMYYPTSAQLWRRTEEMEGLLDHWVAKLARHQAAEIASAKSARPWQSQRPATAISAPPNPTTAPPRCLQTRDDVLLERLPYLRRITRDEGERRSLDRVTQYRGIGSRWSQLPDVPEAGPDERGMRSGYTQPAADGSVAHAPPSEAMEQLILSDDDIEDDDDD